MAQWLRSLTVCSSRGPSFSSQSPHDGPKPYAILDPEDTTHSTGIFGHCMHKTFIHEL